MDKKGVFIGETENGYWVEIPAEGKRWVYGADEFKVAIAKVEELMTDRKAVVERPQ